MSIGLCINIWYFGIAFCAGHLKWTIRLGWSYRKCITRNNEVDYQNK